METETDKLIVDCFISCIAGAKRVDKENDAYTIKAYWVNHIIRIDVIKK